MKKRVLIFSILFLVILGVDCFAQSTEARTRAFQGEWLVIAIDDMDFSKPPFSEIVETTWIFDGNHYLMKINNLEERKVEVQSGTFRIIADGIIFSHQDGVTQTGTYTLQRDILTINLEGTVIVCRKR